MKMTEHVRDIEYFDGPLLSQFKTEDGRIFLWKWASVVGDRNIWLVFETSEESVFTYLLGEIDYYDLIKGAKDDRYYICALSDSSPMEIDPANAMGFTAIPQSYLPVAGCMYNPSLAP